VGLTGEAEDERKLICQLLNKLYVPPTIDDWKMRTLLVLISNVAEVGTLSLLIYIYVADHGLSWVIQQHRALTDMVSRNALAKFDKSVRKEVGDRADAMNEDELREAEELRELWDWLDEKGVEDALQPARTPRKSRTRTTSGGNNRNKSYV
jgi:condensin complex subunit 3